MKIQISKELSLPTDLVTQVEVILAKRRAGKSYTMRRITEQFLKASQQVVIVDPKGDQWGLRSSADGKQPGYPVLILGGEHGDLPLETNAGEVVARLVVEEQVSLLLDLSQFRKHEVATFMTAFLENLYRLKAQEKYRTPVKLIVDEADAIAPQKPQKGEERMLGAIEDIVRRGGQRGIGCTLVTQRSAVLNKNVLTQAQILVVLRTIAPQDLAAMKAWIDVHGTAEQGKELMDSLPSLPIGDAWFWSPGWPTEEGIFKRVHVLPIETFDSGATPKAGERKIVPKNLADVNLDVLKKQMAGTIEKARSEDPKILRKRIAELERHQCEHDGPVDKRAIALEKAETAQEWRSVVGAMEREAGGYKKEIERMRKVIGAMDNLFTQGRKIAGGELLRKVSLVSTGTPTLYERNFPGKPTPDKMPIVLREGLEVPRPQQKILDSLKWAHGIGLSPIDKTQLALLADVSPTSGGYFNNLGALRSAGLINYPTGGTVELTGAGADLARDSDIPTTSEELQDQLYRKLPTPQSVILKVLIDIHPKPINKDELAERIGVSATSGGYFNNLGRLRSLGLAEYPAAGTVRASDLLFIK